MNGYWLVTSLLCIGTSALRSFAFITSIAPSNDELATPILAWYYTAWFIVSGLFLLGGLVFLVLCFKHKEYAANQIATLLVAMFCMAAMVVVVVNFLMFSYYSFEPMIMIGLIITFAVLGIAKQSNEGAI